MNSNVFQGGDDGFGGSVLSWKDLPQLVECGWMCAINDECVTYSGGYMDDFLFKRNRDTRNRPFIRERDWISEVNIVDVTCNENYENVYANIDSRDYPTIEPRYFHAAIAIKSRFKKWQNTPYVESCVDLAAELVEAVKMRYDEVMSEALFAQLNKGELNTSGNVFAGTPGEVASVPIFGSRPLFGLQDYNGTAVNNLFVASTAPAPYTYVPYTDIYGVTIAANPVAVVPGAVGRTLFIQDLEQATRIMKRNNAVSWKTGRTTSCGCNDYVLYKNCNDIVQQYQQARSSNGTTIVDPVPSQVLTFSSCQGITVSCRESNWINSGTALLVSSNHNMFYGEVFDPEVIFKDSSKTVGNERHDYIEFEWTVMYGVTKPVGLLKIVF